MKINKPKGFSLMELMIVIGIIAILAAIAVPQYNIFTYNNALKSAARDLAGDIQLIRQNAMSNNSTYTLNFTSNTQYNYCIPPSCIPPNGQPTQKDVTTFHPDITFVQNFGAKITFTPRGTMTPLGTITLSNSRNSTVKLTASPPAGRINVQYTTMH